MFQACFNCFKPVSNMIQIYSWGSWWLMGAHVAQLSNPVQAPQMFHYFTILVMPPLLVQMCFNCFKYVSNTSYSSCFNHVCFKHVPNMFQLCVKNCFKICWGSWGLMGAQLSNTVNTPAKGFINLHI